jgi:hypothetical protein
VALTADQLKLYQWAVEAMPNWFSEQERSEEWLNAAAKEIDVALQNTKFWFSQTYILDAVGATPGEPDWLNQHAIDRGTYRRDGETNVALRRRLRNPADALTRAIILALIDLMLSEAGIVGTAAMVELRRDKIYLGDYVSGTGTGGVFTNPSGDTFLFDPTVRMAAPPREGVDQLELSGASSAGNDGDFLIDDLVDNASQYENLSGIAEIDATVSWSWVKYDEASGVVLDGFAKSYLSRGYRVSHTDGPPMFIIILPYGTDAALAASVAETVRQRRAAGVVYAIEYRQSPP